MQKQCRNANNQKEMKTPFKPVIIEIQLLFNDDHILTVPGKHFEVVKVVVQKTICMVKITD